MTSPTVPRRRRRERRDRETRRRLERWWLKRAHLTNRPRRRVLTGRRTGDARTLTMPDLASAPLGAERRYPRRRQRNDLPDAPGTRRRVPGRGRAKRPRPRIDLQQTRLPCRAHDQPRRHPMDRLTATQADRIAARLASIVAKHRADADAAEQSGDHDGAAALRTLADSAHRAYYACSRRRQDRTRIASTPARRRRRHSSTSHDRIGADRGNRHVRDGFDAKPEHKRETDALAARSKGPKTAIAKLSALLFRDLRLGGARSARGQRVKR